MGSFDEAYKFGTDIVHILKAIDSGKLDDYKEIYSKKISSSNQTHLYIGDFRIGYHGDTPENNRTIFNIHSKIIRHRPEYGCIDIFNANELVPIYANDIVLTPTEEQYFQNSLVYYHDLHLERFVIFGIMVRTHFIHKEIMVDYTFYDKLLQYAHEVL